MISNACARNKEQSLKKKKKIVIIIITILLLMVLMANASPNAHPTQREPELIRLTARPRLKAHNVMETEEYDETMMIIFPLNDNHPHENLNSSIEIVDSPFQVYQVCFSSLARSPAKCQIT